MNYAVKKALVALDSWKSEISLETEFRLTQEIREATKGMNRKERLEYLMKRLKDGK